MWLMVEANSQLIGALWPRGFELMGIKDENFARGLCLSGTNLFYFKGESPVMFVIVQWRSLNVGEIWLLPMSFSNFNDLKAPMFALREVLFEKLKLEKAFMFCLDRPKKRVAKALGATTTETHCGVVYEWGANDGRK